ncbi:MAG TPA: ABC transporter permease [Gemmatimonadaceae bacterium]
MRPDDEELDEEIRGHMALSMKERIERGEDPTAARLAARKEFGNVPLTRDAMRGVWSNRWIEMADALAQDIRFALRSLRRAKGLVTAVVLTLALGIGANTAIFSVIRGVLLKPLPHRNGDRLIYIRQSTDGPGGANVHFSVPEITDFRNGAKSLAGIAEYSSWTNTLLGDDGATRIKAGLVTGNFFEVMGLSPVLGRLTRPSDDGPGVEAVIVLTHQFWMKHFAGDSSIVGKQLKLEGGSATVIGVLQPAPFFPNRVDALFNMVVSKHHLSAQMVQGRSHRMTEVVARLAPGATVEQARSEIDAVYARMQGQYKDAYEAGAHYRVAVMPFKDALGENARLTLWLLMGAAAFVLIISVANVANLTLMRGVRREHELVVRAALGAGVARLRRLLLVENLALTSLGAIMGGLVALGGMRMLVSLAERYSPRANEIQLDVVALGFTLAVSVLVALSLSFVAFVPREGGLSIISAGARTSGGLRKQRVQRGLVVAQVAVSVVLLAGAGLLTRTMLQLSEVETGLKTEEVLAIDVQLLALGSGDFARIMAADVAAKEGYDRIRREIKALPGVTEVALGSVMPLGGSDFRFDIKAEGKSPAVGEPTPRAEYRTADPAYFRAAGIPLMKGRAFAATDAPGGGRVAVINQTLANKLFPNEDPIGKRIAWTGPVLKFTPISPEWRTIVGVVGNTQDGGLDAQPGGVVFMPFAQELALGGTLVVRADSNVAALRTNATQIVRRIAPTVPIDRVMTIAQIKDQSVAPRRLNAALVSSFGILAVVIAAVGIAGVLAFSVSTRTNEIGIRMSLGADRARVQRMILKEGGVLLAAGLALGVTGAFFAARVIQGLLFGIAPHDPTTFTSVALMMAAIGLAACWVPALRAARIDPAITIRS